MVYLILILHLIGVIVSYFITRWALRFAFGEYYNRYDQIFNIFISLIGSWFTALMFLFLMLFCKK